MKIFHQFLFWVVFHLSMIYVDGNSGKNHVKCNPNEENSCPSGYCCAKEVYVPADVTKPAKGYILCKARLRRDEFCLHRSEGFLCDCEEGLQCISEEPEENFGHCRRPQSLK